MQNDELFHDLIKSAIAGSAFEIYNNVPRERQQCAIEAVGIIAVEIAQSALEALEAETEERLMP